MEDYLEDLDSPTFTGSPVATKTAAPATTDQGRAVHGLVDGRGAADLLGFGETSPRRVSVWYAKRTQSLKDGKALTPLLSLLPEPVGVLNAGMVFTEQSILDFGIAAGFLEAEEPAPAESSSIQPFNGEPRDDETF